MRQYECGEIRCVDEEDKQLEMTLTVTAFMG